MKKYIGSLWCILAIVSCKEEPPVDAIKACFNISLTGTQGIPILFETCTTEASSYHWYFGDGQEATASSTQHVYGLPGKYAVSLTVEKSGMKDSVTRDITISLSAKQTSCLPTYLYSPEMWPAPTYDSVTINYTAARKVDFIMQRPRVALGNPNNKLAFYYNSGGKISTIDFIHNGTKSGTYTFSYDTRSLPLKLTFVGPLGNTDLSATYKHSDTNQLTEIAVQTNFGIYQFYKIRYEYDTNGNTSKIFHTLGTEVEELERENKSFANSLVYYYSSPELRQYIEYITFGGVYQNNVSTARVYSTITPDLAKYALWNGAAGLQVVIESTIDSQLNMVTKTAETGTDDVDSYRYTCF